MTKEEEEIRVKGKEDREKKKKTKSLVRKHTRHQIANLPV